MAAELWAVHGTAHQWQCTGDRGGWHDAQHTSEVLHRHSIAFEQLAGNFGQPGCCHGLGGAKGDEVGAGTDCGVHRVIELQDAAVYRLDKGWQRHLFNGDGEVSAGLAGLGLGWNGPQVAGNERRRLWAGVDLRFPRN